MQSDDIKVKFETLRTMNQTTENMDAMENHMSEHVSNNKKLFTIYFLKNLDIYQNFMKIY